MAGRPWRTASGTSATTLVVDPPDGNAGSAWREIGTVCSRISTMRISPGSASALRQANEVCSTVGEGWSSSAEFNSFDRSPAASQARHMTIGTNSNGDGNPKCDERSIRHPRRALCRIGETLRRFLSGALETYGIWHRSEERRVGERVWQYV